MKKNGNITYVEVALNDKHGLKRGLLAKVDQITSTIQLKGPDQETPTVYNTKFWAIVSITIGDSFGSTDRFYKDTDMDQDLAWQKLLFVQNSLFTQGKANVKGNISHNLFTNLPKEYKKSVIPLGPTSQDKNVAKNTQTDNTANKSYNNNTNVYKPNTANTYKKESKVKTFITLDNLPPKKLLEKMFELTALAHINKFEMAVDISEEESNSAFRNSVVDSDEDYWRRYGVEGGF